MTVSENDTYGKLQVMNWNDIWYMSFSVLKILSEFTFIFPINLPNFVSFPVQSALGVQLGSKTQWKISLKYEYTWATFEFISLFEIF